MPYAERLRYLDVPSLELRRLYLDLIHHPLLQNGIRVGRPRVL